jgi:protein-disulfide isomerase-like protein with CxxC motif
MSIDVVEYTDPGCIWSWSAEPAIRRLRERPGMRWRRVFGVPRRGGADPLPGWREVASETGAPLTDVLHWIPQSMLPASLAARAADHQGRAVAEAVLLRLREATFLHGRPADTTDRVADALRGIPGLDLFRLIRDLDSPDVVFSIEADMAEARRPRREAVTREEPGGELRYAFPTLLIDDHVVSGWHALAETTA